MASEHQASGRHARVQFGGRAPNEQESDAVSRLRDFKGEKRGARRRRTTERRNSMVPWVEGAVKSGAMSPN